MTFHNREFVRQGVQRLTEDQLYQIAPSIFATEAHSSRSDKFVPVPTIEVLRALEKEGFVPFSAKQGRTRDASRREFTKHMIRLRHVDGQKVINGSTAEVILKNGNDGTCAYNLMAGLFRFVCFNGLIVADGEVEKVRVGHIGRKVADDVIEGTFRVIGESELALERANEWSQLRLPAPVQEAYADAAKVLRFDEGQTVPETREVLRVRRSADSGNSLFEVYNRVQENLVKGGLSYRGANNRRMSTREISGIDQDVKLNQALWTLTEKMAELVK